MPHGEGGHDPRRLSAVAQLTRHCVQSDDEPRSDRRVQRRARRPHARTLREKGLSRRVMATGQRVVKHRHVVDEGLGINAGRVRDARRPAAARRADTGRAEEPHRTLAPLPLARGRRRGADRLAGSRRHAPARAPARPEGIALESVARPTTRDRHVRSARRLGTERRRRRSPSTARAPNRSPRPNRNRIEPPPEPHSLEVRDPATATSCGRSRSPRPARSPRRSNGRVGRSAPGRRASYDERATALRAFRELLERRARRVRARHDAGDGQADPAVAQRSARRCSNASTGTSRHVGDVIAPAIRHERRPSRTDHLRADRCRRAHQRVELSVLRRR